MSGIRISIGFSFVGVSLFFFSANAGTWEVYQCVEFENGVCIKKEIVPTDKSQTVLNNCTEIGGSFDPFGSCIIASNLPRPTKLDIDAPVPPVGPTENEGLRAYAKACEDVAKKTVDVCTRSSAMLSRARSQMDQLNDVIAGQSSMSAAEACTGMQDAVSASRVQMKAWQQTCGDALSNCQHTCEPTLVAVKLKVELVEQTKNAIQSCNAFVSERDDVRRSIAMASSAVESSSLCRRQLGADQARRQERSDAAANPDTVSLPPSPSNISSNSGLPHNYDTPQILGPGTVVRTSDSPQPQAARLPTTDDRDVQGAGRRPSTTATAAGTATQTKVAMNEPKKLPTERQPATGSPVRFPTGVARATLDGTNRPGNNSRGWPIPVNGVTTASTQTFAPTINAIPTAVHRGLEAIGQAKNFAKPTFGPMTREPSSIEGRSFREIGIAGRNANIFRNIRSQFIRLSGSFYQ